MHKKKTMRRDNINRITCAILNFRGMEHFATIPICLCCIMKRNGLKRIETKCIENNKFFAYMRMTFRRPAAYCQLLKPIYLSYIHFARIQFKMSCDWRHKANCVKLMVKIVVILMNGIHILHITVHGSSQSIEAYTNTHTHTRMNSTLNSIYISIPYICTVRHDNAQPHGKHIPCLSSSCECNYSFYSTFTLNKLFTE